MPRITKARSHCPAGTAVNRAAPRPDPPGTVPSLGSTRQPQCSPATTAEQFCFLIDLITPNLYEAELHLVCEVLSTGTLMSCLIHIFRALVINYTIGLSPGFTTRCSKASLGFWRMSQCCLAHDMCSVRVTQRRSPFRYRQGAAALL